MSTKIHAACALSSARQIPLCRPFLSGPKPPRHERQPVCSVAAGDLYGPCRQLQMSRSQKKHKLLDFFFLPFFKPQTRSPKFPQQIKSKLLKGWFTPALISLLPPHPHPPTSWCVTLLKRDSATRQCSEDEHHPGDLTQRWCLGFWWRPSGRQRGKRLLWLAVKWSTFQTLQLSSVKRGIWRDVVFTHGWQECRQCILATCKVFSKQKEKKNGGGVVSERVCDSLQ